MVGPRECPVEGCRGRGGVVDEVFYPSAFPAPECKGHRGHIGVVQPPHSRRLRCDMLLPWTDLNGRHPNTAQYAKGVERKRRSMVVEKIQASI